MVFMISLKTTRPKHYHFECECRTGQPELVGLIRYFSSLRKRGIIDDETYYELSRYVATIVIQRGVECVVDKKLDQALSEKFSPQKLLEALALA